MTLKHSHQTAIADDPAYDVGADEWNGDHVVSGTSGQLQYNNLGSLTGLPLSYSTNKLTFASGADSDMLIGLASTNYTDISFNGTLTFANMIGLGGGKAGDPIFYYNAPVGGQHLFCIAGTDYVAIDANGINAGVSDLPLGQSGLGWGLLYLHPGTLAQRNAWGAAKGAVGCITDSNTTTWGATISGGGANSVLAWYNGTNWTVIGA